MHRRRPLEPPIGTSRPLPRPRPGKPFTKQDPVHRPLRRRRDTLGPGRWQPAEQLQPDPLRTPPQMHPPELHHRRLHQRLHPMRTPPRTMRPIRQPGDRPLQIPTDPAMHRRPCHPITDGHLDHTLPGQHRPNRVQPLLDNRQDNQRHPRPLTRRCPTKTPPLRVAETGPTVADQLTRNRRTSPGTGQTTAPTFADRGSS
jgi:hypothetical protein